MGLFYRVWNDRFLSSPSERDPCSRSLLCQFCLRFRASWKGEAVRRETLWGEAREAMRDWTSTAALAMKTAIRCVTALGRKDREL